MFEIGTLSRQVSKLALLFAIFMYVFIFSHPSVLADVFVGIHSDRVL